MTEEVDDKGPVTPGLCCRDASTGNHGTYQIACTLSENPAPQPRPDTPGYRRCARSNEKPPRVPPLRVRRHQINCELTSQARAGNTSL